MMKQLGRQALFVVLCLVSGAIGVQAQTPFSHAGFGGSHATYSPLPNEHVDPASGTLLLSDTDLVLPGNAGLDLVVRRFYNSGVRPGFDAGDMSIEEDSWAGIGWTLHFGRVLHVDQLQPGVTKIEMSDGSRHALHTTTAFPEGWITTDLWRYDRNTNVLKMPNGIVYTFGHLTYVNDRIGWARYVTEIKDQFNNRLTFGYFSSPGPRDGVAWVHQFLGDVGGVSQERHVAFTYDANNSLSTMQYLDRFWTYTHEAASGEGHSLLRTVQPPVGRPTTYHYGSGATGEMTGITTGSGGVITYNYEQRQRRAGPLTVEARVIVLRTIGGHQVTPGTWTFTYGAGSNQDTTVVDCACGRTTYRFVGTGLAGDFSAWSSGALAEQTIEQGAEVLERQTFEWQKSDAISPDPIAGQDGVWADPAVYRPLFKKRTVTRGAQSWTSESSYHTGNFNDYGQPYQIVETGEFTRTTTRTFTTGFAPYLAPQVSTETTTANGGSRSTTLQYDLGTGFILTRQGSGPTTSFEPTPLGNVAAVVDGRGNRTSFSYSWGVVSAINTPTTSTWSELFIDGNVYRSHLLNGATELVTTFAYTHGRVASVQPPGGSNPTLYSYDDVAGQWTQVARGTTYERHDLDGFGAVVSTSSSSGVRARTTRDACGRVIFASVPYTSGAGTVGTTSAYDALGRLQTTTDPAGAVTSFTYAGIDVTVLDAEQRSTLFDYSAAGSPEAALLTRVRDAAQSSTLYTYDVFEQLASATLPGGTAPVRTWSRNAHGLLAAETQPESATTSHVYDGSGNLMQTVDSLGQQVFRLHDSDNRLHQIDYSGTAEDMTLTYDAVGRPWTQSIPGTSLTLTYDPAGRLEYRTDVVGSQTVQSRYTYDLNDNLKTITYPSGRVVEYGYDANDRLTQVKQNNTVFADLFIYDDAGRLTSYRTGGVTQTIEYDAAQRVRRMTTGSLLDLTYGYDDVGNVRSITDPRPGASQSFTVDAVNRLATASGAWGQLSWGYDAAGNRLWERTPTQTTYVYNTPTQRLMSTTGANVETFVYDNVGRLTSDSRGTYSYKPSGLLAAVTAPGVTASYEYDPSGLRIIRTVNGQTSYSFRSAGGDILSEFAVPCGGAMVWTKDTIYAGGRPLGAVKAAVTQPSIEFVSATQSVSEGQPSVILSARLTTPGQSLSCAATVAYETRALMAKEGADFTRTSGVLTFPAGSANGATASMTVPVSADALDESNETFRLMLSTVTGAALGAATEATVTILDDDPTPSLTVSNVMVTEGQSGSSNAVFTVSLSAVSGQDVQATYVTAPGTATAPSDYSAVGGVVSIPEGASSATIAVAVSGDTVREATERFVVTLSQPANAVVADASGIGTIVNDDNAGSVLHDFDSDGKADVVVFRPTDSTGGTWYMLFSGGAPSTTVQWGGLGDIPVAADYDGDGRTDVAVFRETVGTWYVKPWTSSPTGVQFGAYGDVPVPADYDGDGKADFVVYRPSEAKWYMLLSTGTSLSKQWGAWGDIPMPADYDGDGKADVAVYRPSTGVWYIWRSTTDSAVGIQFGGATGDVPVAADYDGDGLADVGVYKPNESLGGTWDVRYSSTGTVVTVQWGVSTDLLVPADFDGDGAADLAVFRPSNGTWYSWLSSADAGMGIQWGASVDIPASMRPRNPNY